MEFLLVAYFALWLVCGLGLVLLEEPFSWQLRSRCSISGKIFFSPLSDLPCPCHGENRESVVSRWRPGGWQVKGASEAEAGRK